MIPSGRSISILLLIGSVVWGCASQRASGSGSLSPRDRDQVEVTCEIALMRLDNLIVKRSAQSDFPPAVLLEAKELYRMGKELYLEREYALALEIIEEGIQLVEEESE